MFETFFPRNRNVDIDRLIFDISEYKRTRDYEAFCHLIPGHVFFVRVDAASINEMPSGIAYRVKSSDRIKLTGLAKIQGLTLLPLYTSSDDKRLHDSYAEIEGLEALRMAVKGAGVEGILFQNKGQSWLVLKTDQIKQVLAKHDRQ
ncbi:MAG TPA: hypothetical protein VKB26_07965 [Candidatus Acidoferrales bacterium]|nr:hypothetical protein [Candidatus Acidoferrales bacterium]